jgi:hypothetical protein
VCDKLGGGAAKGVCFADYIFLYLVDLCCTLLISTAVQWSKAQSPYDVAHVRTGSYCEEGMGSTEGLPCNGQQVQEARPDCTAQQASTNAGLHEGELDDVDSSMRQGINQPCLLSSDVLVP